LSNAAIAITDASNTFTHGTAEGSWIAFISESRFKGAIIGYGIGWGTFTCDGAAHGCSFVASEIVHAAAVVGGVASSRWKAKIGVRFTDQQFTVGTSRAVLPIAALGGEVSGNNATGGKRVTALSKAAVRIDFADAIVDIAIGARVSGPVAMSVKLRGVIRGAEGFTFALLACFVAIAIVGCCALDADSVITVGLRCVQATCIVFTARTASGSNIWAARGAQSE